MRVLATIMILAGFVSPVAAQVAGPMERAGEREALRKSLDEACTQFVGDEHWDEADACRRAWFDAHEEAIWRLNLNPHPAPLQPPS